MTKPKRKGKKKPKLEIKFDSEARREFLSGFHKRKLQKKAFYKSKLEKRLALEKQRIRAEAKKVVGRTSSSHSILPEVEKIIGFTQAELDDELKTKSESFVLGSKTVTISSLDDIHPTLSPLESEDDENSDGASDGGEDHQDPPTQNVKAALKRCTSQLLRQSKTYKASQRLKQNSKKSRAKNRLARSRTSSGKGDGNPDKSIRVKNETRFHPKSKKGKRAKKSGK